ncbi:lysozyme [Muribaculaceae bacterium Isolate-007 (NCI)]|nr:lysozyme [Muribaculaceae bacterium Isolate-007 (NCI)]
MKKLKSGNRDIFKAYTAHCRYKGKFHAKLHQRRLTEIAALFVK